MQLQKRKEIIPFKRAWMDLEIIMLSENKPVRERQIPYDLTYNGNLRKKIN